MAWPSTSAGTTHLDAGTDNPGLARADIKQAVDNVNAIKDEFGDVSITSVADAQVLKYNAANSRWENAAGGGTQGEAVAYFRASANITDPDNSSPNHDFGLSYSEDVDTGSIISVVTGGSFTNVEGDTTQEQYIALASGTYIVKISGMAAGTAINNFKLMSWNESTKTNTQLVALGFHQIFSTGASPDSLDAGGSQSDEIYGHVVMNHRFTMSGDSGIKITTQPYQAGFIGVSLQCEIIKE